MSEIVIRFDLRLGKRVFSAALVPALMLTAVPQLGSESVTLSTYYPAPSGVYTNMITTSNTYLARDGGNLGVGTSGPTSKLHVNGTSNLAGATTVGGALTVNGNATVNGSGVALNVAQNTAIRVGNSYLSSGGNYMHLANNEYYNGGAWVPTGGAGVLLQFSGQQVAFYTHNGGGSHSGLMLVSPGVAPSGGWGHVSIGSDKIDVSGHVVARAQGTCTTAHVRSYATTGTTACPAGRYATFYSGMMSKYVMAPRYVDVQGNSAVAWMLCCPCPTGGCPSL